MSRSYKKNPCWAICGGWRSSHIDKTIASRCVRRRNKILIKTTTDFNDYTPLHRLQCGHNEVYSWGRDGNQHWHNPPKHDHLADIIIEIDWMTQVERVLDGKPAINKPLKEWDGNSWYKRMMRK